MSFELLGRNLKAMLTKMISVKRWRSITERKGRQIVNVEGREVTHLQEWGFFGKAPEGSGEAICIYPRGSADHGYAVLIDGSGRPKDLEDGECGLFNSEGVILRLKGKTVTIEGADKIETVGDVTMTGDVTVKGNLEVKEATSVSINGLGISQLVRMKTLSAIATHTHPMGVDPVTLTPIAAPSLDPLMVALPTDVTNITTFLKA